MTTATVHQDRIARAQTAMREAGVDLLCVGPSADLFYLTGINAHLSERLNLLLVPATGRPMFVVPRLEAPNVANKADLVEPSANDGDAPAPTIAGSVLVSARTGYGMDVLRARLSALLADLWEDVDVSLPYSEGELLSRVRERGTVEIGYRARDVRVHGRVAPTLAAELRAAQERWRPTAAEVG